MKKNRTARIAALLLGLFLITAMIAGNSLAKFTTGAASIDTSARNAKWDVEFHSYGELFAKEYRSESASTLSVKSDEKIVAPGTSGSLGTFRLTGSPEVATKLEISADLSLSGWSISGPTQNESLWNASKEKNNGTGGQWRLPDGDYATPENTGLSSDSSSGLRPPILPASDELGDREYIFRETRTITPSLGKFKDQQIEVEFVTTWDPTLRSKQTYIPLVITVGQTRINGLDYSDAALYEAAVERAIKAYEAQYDAGTDLSAVPLPSISWQWAIDGDDDRDSTLGVAAANGSPATIAFALSLSVTQVG